MKTHTMRTIRKNPWSSFFKIGAGIAFALGSLLLLRHFFYEDISISAAFLCIVAAMTCWLAAHYLDLHTKFKWWMDKGYTREDILKDPSTGKWYEDDLEKTLKSHLLSDLNKKDGLTQQIDNLQHRLDFLPLPVLLLDDRGLLTWWNRALESIFQNPKKATHITDYIRHPEVLSLLDSLQQGKRNSFSYEYHHPADVSRIFHLTGQAVGPDTLKAHESSLLLSFLDITEIKRGEALRADFIANASHELRTPLSSLIGFIETLQGETGEDREARVKFLGIMQDQASRMERLIDDLLSLSRIEVREHSKPDERVDLVALLDDLVTDFSPKSRRKSMPILLKSAQSISLYADREELQQLFQNLVDNALKYGKRGSEVQITCEIVTPGDDSGARRLGKKAVRCDVANEGEGIAREHIPRLTERFYRVDSSRSREMGGTGLGLAIVKHITARHRGLLQIESEPGKGAVFSVYLPLSL